MKDNLEVTIKRMEERIMYRYELLIMWYDGMKDTFQFKNEAAAEEAERGFKKAFGAQVVFSCIRKVPPDDKSIIKRGSRE